MNEALIGVPLSRRLSIVDRLTVPGALETAVARREDRDDTDLTEAIVSVRTGLTRYASSAAENQYYRNLSTNLYDVGLQGMDGEWADVFKTFAVEIGKGVAGKISGKNPWQTSQTIVEAPKPTPTPGWVKFAAVGGAGALLLFLVMNARRG